ncbi:MAG: thioredoxin 1 [Candidatus Omnitrophota bacterium]|jgi:thioredoxin 1
MSALHLTQDSFESEVLKADGPVLVDLWAEWCGPCKAIGPIIDELATELTGKLKVTKLDIDQAQEIAAKFNVMSIPTMLVFKNGEVVEQIVGAVPKEAILAKVTPHLG